MILILKIRGMKRCVLKALLSIKAIDQNIYSLNYNDNSDVSIDGKMLFTTCRRTIGCHIIEVGQINIRSFLLGIVRNPLRCMPVHLVLFRG